jgi:hypothetical protein
MYVYEVYITQLGVQRICMAILKGGREFLLRCCAAAYAVRALAAVWGVAMPLPTQYKSVDLHVS